MVDEAIDEAIDEDMDEAIDEVIDEEKTDSSTPSRPGERRGGESRVIFSSCGIHIHHHTPVDRKRNDGERMGRYPPLHLYMQPTVRRIHRRTRKNPLTHPHPLDALFFLRRSWTHVVRRSSVFVRSRVVLDTIDTRAYYYSVAREYIYTHIIAKAKDEREEREKGKRKTGSGNR